MVVCAADFKEGDIFDVLLRVTLLVMIMFRLLN